LVTKAVPAVRFADEEQHLLQPLPARVYRSLILDPRDAQVRAASAAAASAHLSIPQVAVERRSLASPPRMASRWSSVACSRPTTPTCLAHGSTRAALHRRWPAT
jgi:hypothetical protein